jgi:aryl-alcohol dehydrogenase-like predicted oxidoreductase
MSRKIVENAINRSLRRMKVKSLDMLQFHWWDYSDNNYITTLEILNDLRQEGKIRHLSLTNFDTEHLRIIVEHGIPIVSNQIQFSVLDQRPLEKMVPYCEANKIHLLAYGTLGGGLYTKRFYNSNPPRYSDLSTSSLQKYYGMVQKWGNWSQFQEFLKILHDLSQKYHVSMANIAMRWVIEQPAVSALIVGTRLSLSDHIQDSLNLYSFQLGSHDHQRIRDIYKNGNDLFLKIGDCGDEYR